MRVGLEGSPFFGRRTGVGQYAARLVSAAAQLDSSVELEIVRFWWPWRKNPEPIPAGKRLGYRLIRWFPPAVYFQIFKRLGWFLPYDFFALKKYDTFVFFNFVVFPLRRRTKAVAVVHDLSFIHYPQFTQHKNLPYMVRFVPSSIKKANHIITVSQSTKRQIVDHYHVAADKVNVITPAIDHQDFYPRKQVEADKARAKYSLPTRYILFTGTLEPRKNVVGILNAYQALPPQLKIKFPLVLAGGRGWKDEEIQAKLSKLKAAGEQIIQPGYVADEDLAAVFSGASLFVYPSFYEGFGIPPLEAMACGVPVITADNSSLPEVVGDAAIKVKAGDDQELSLQMVRVLTSPKLSASLQKKGLDQAKKYNWQTSAQKFLDLLEKL